MTMKNLNLFVMEMIAVLVNITKKTLIGKSQFLDTSDYIGCYAKEEGLTSNRIFKTLMTNCYCVGYCRSLNFSLAGLYQ